MTRLTVNSFGVYSPSISNVNRIHSGGFRDKPASLSHFSSNGLSLHMFLKLRFKASKREMVVWLKSFPYSFPMARPTSPWWQETKKLFLKGKKKDLACTMHIFTIDLKLRKHKVFVHACVKPSLIRRCLKVLANCSSSSKSLGSSRVGVSNRLGGVWLWGWEEIGAAAVVRVGVVGCRKNKKDHYACLK